MTQSGHIDPDQAQLFERLNNPQKEEKGKKTPCLPPGFI
jgi:hypothetical protein